MSDDVRLAALGGVHKADCNALFTGCDCGYEQALLDAAYQHAERKARATIDGAQNSKGWFTAAGPSADYLAGLADGERRVIGVLAAVVESEGGYVEVPDKVMATRLSLTSQRNEAKMTMVFITRPEGTKP